MDHIVARLDEEIARLRSAVTILTEVRRAEKGPMVGVVGASES